MNTTLHQVPNVVRELPYPAVSCHWASIICLSSHRTVDRLVVDCYLKSDEFKRRGDDRQCRM